MISEKIWNSQLEGHLMRDNNPDHSDTIPRLIILNLESRMDKAFACYGANVSRGVPQRRISFWRATPAADYPVPKDMVEAAADDGYPFFKEYYNKYGGKVSRATDNYPTSVLTQAWDYCKVLDYIADSGENTLFLYDDRYVVNFFYLQQEIFILIKHQEAYGSEPLRFVQLEYNWHWEINFKHLKRVDHVDRPWVIEGPAGGSENAIFYTPEGAAWMSDYIQNNYVSNIESTLCQLVNEPREKRYGIWTVEDVAWVRLIPMGSDIKGNKPNMIKNMYINEEKQITF